MEIRRVRARARRWKFLNILSSSHSVFSCWHELYLLCLREPSSDFNTTHKIDDILFYDEESKKGKLRSAESEKWVGEPFVRKTLTQPLILIDPYLCGDFSLLHKMMMLSLRKNLCMMKMFDIHIEPLLKCLRNNFSNLFLPPPTIHFCSTYVKVLWATLRHHMTTLFRTCSIYSTVYKHSFILSSARCYQSLASWKIEIVLTSCHVASVP